MDAMNVTLFLLAMAMGISAYVAFHHFSLWLLRRSETLHLWVASWCVSSLLFQAGRYVQYTADSAGRALLGGRLSVGAIFLISITALPLVRAMAGRPPSRAFFAWVFGLHVLAFTWLAASALSVPLEIHPMIDSLGREYLGVYRGSLFPSVFLMLLADSAYGFFTLARARMDRTEKAALLVGVVVYLLMALNDMLVYSGLSRWPGLFEFGFAAIARGLDFILVRRFNRLYAGLEEAVADRTRDIAEKNRVLSGALAQAENATRSRSVFLANVSHEIRTPLNGIVGMTQVALDSPLAPPQREVLSTIRSSAESLRRVMDDILDFSKIDAGRLDLAPVPFSLRELLADTCRSFDLEAREKNLGFAWRVSPEAPDRFVGDPHRLRQVLVNLLGNACKFTREGHVTLTVSSPAGTGPRKEREILFAVSDTGIGVAPENQSRIFESFAQESASTSRVYGGTGLGLAISSQLVQLMGGRIWLESEQGRGSTFHFTVILGAPESDSSAQATEKTEAVPWPSCRVLLVEDNAVNRTVAETLLRKWGQDVVCAETGAAALERAGSDAFGLILLDLRLPDMNGEEVARRLREAERSMGRRTPIVALTASALPEDRARCTRAGMDGFLAKPFSADELREAVRRWAVPGIPSRPGSSGERGDVALGPASAPGVDRASLLALVDHDEALLRQVLGMFLEDAPRMMSEVGRALSDGSPDRLARASHALKGSLSHVGSTFALDLAQKLERSAGSGEWAEAAATYDRLRLELSRLLPALEALRLEPGVQ